MASSIITFSVLAAAFAVGTPLEVRETSYCTFYSDDLCQVRSGSTSYSIDNPGIFQNGGPYLKCGTAEEFNLQSFPPQGAQDPNHCVVYVGPDVSNNCVRLTDDGFTPGDGGYYKFAHEKTCPPTSGKRSTGADANGTLVERNSDYLTFYVDPACTQRSGSTDYATKNNGCFTNVAAYAAYGGDNPNWHLAQYGDDSSCGGGISKCVDAGDSFYHPTPASGNPCLKLDDIGFNSGYGSWMMGGGGCP